MFLPRRRKKTIKWFLFRIVYILYKKLRRCEDSQWITVVHIFQFLIWRTKTCRKFDNFVANFQNKQTKKAQVDVSKWKKNGYLSGIRQTPDACCERTPDSDREEDERRGKNEHKKAFNVNI